MISDVFDVFIALLAFYFIVPYIMDLIRKSINDFKMMKRAGKISIPIAELDYAKNSENLGLSGPIFGRIPFINFIAEGNKGFISRMRRLLLTAGIRSRGALEIFMVSKIITGTFLFCLALTFFIKKNADTPLWLSILLSIVIAILGGHRLPTLYLQLIGNRRRKAIQNGIPDFVDLLVICFESGLDLNGSIKRIALELSTSNSILADELHVTSLELEMALDHRLVFENLENRAGCHEIMIIGKTFSHSIEYGSELNVSLKDLAISMRQKRMLAAETKAARVPSMLTLPMVLFTMPCLFIIMLGPVLIGVLKSVNTLQ